MPKKESNSNKDLSSKERTTYIPILLRKGYNNPRRFKLSNKRHKGQRKTTKTEHRGGN
jgi:hypothetical protein